MGFLLALIGASGFIGGGVQMSRAGEIHLVSYTGSDDFLVSSLKNSSVIAATIPQETFSSGYSVVSKPNEFVVPLPPVKPARESVDVIESLTAQAACMTGGMFDACPGFLDLLQSRQQAWPRFADVTMPEMDALLTTGSVSDAVVASTGATTDVMVDDGVAVVDRVARRCGEVIMGAAWTYNPYDANDNDAGGAETASGELYNPISWTAAIQTHLRDKFAGVRYGRLYTPTFALVELNGRRAIIKINDVGPLRPGRVIDLSTQAMHYFDPTLTRGVLDGALITPLVGSDWTPGPVGAMPAVALAAN